MVCNWINQLAQMAQDIEFLNHHFTLSHDRKQSKEESLESLKCRNIFLFVQKLLPIASSESGRLSCPTVERSVSTNFVYISSVAFGKIHCGTIKLEVLHEESKISKGIHQLLIF